jgi:hypothetical protein
MSDEGTNEFPTHTNRFTGRYLLARVFCLASFLLFTSLSSAQQTTSDWAVADQRKLKQHAIQSSPQVATESGDYRPIDGVPHNPERWINPSFQPRCRYEEGEYDCRHIANDYCEQYPTPGNCFPMIICGLPEPEAENPCHVLVLIRIDLGNGIFSYCAVEPSWNQVLPNTCWTTTDNTYDPSQLSDRLCQAYRPSYPTMNCPFGPRPPGLKPYLEKLYPEREFVLPFVFPGRFPIALLQWMHLGPLPTLKQEAGETSLTDGKQFSVGTKPEPVRDDTITGYPKTN